MSEPVDDPERDFRAKVVQRLNEEYHGLLLPLRLERCAPWLTAGKLFRSSIALCIAGRPEKKLVRLCAAIEMLHVSTLVHDDIVDRATERRGYPSLWHALGTERALFVGNLIAGRALELVSDDSKVTRRQFAEAYSRVNEGQLLEIKDRGNLLRTTEEYLRVCDGKTAAMIELAARFGYSACRAPDADVETVVLAIRELGLAFQIIDDIEDVQAWLSIDKGIDRPKHAEFDVEIGNYTLPVLNLLSREADLVDSLVSGESAAIASLLHQSDAWPSAIEEARQEARRHLELAASVLQSARTGKGSGSQLKRIGYWIERLTAGLEGRSLDEAALFPAAMTDVVGQG